MIENPYLNKAISKHLLHIQKAKLQALTATGEKRLILIKALDSYTDSCMKEKWLQSTLLPDNSYQTLDNARSIIGANIAKIKEAAEKWGEYFMSKNDILEIEGITYRYDYYRKERIVASVPETIDNFGLIRTMIILSMLKESINTVKRPKFCIVPITLYITFVREK